MPKFINYLLGFDNSYPKAIRYSLTVKRFEVLVLEHLRVSVHLVPEVLQQHRGGDGGEAEADEAEDKQEAERPHRNGEDVGWMSVGPGVRRRRITAAGESRQRALYDGPWSRHSLGDSGNISGSSVYLYFE